VAKKQRSTKIFYGYIIVLASLLILVIVHGIYASYGVFFSSVQEEFGWDRATISGAHSLAFFLMGLFSTVAGRLTDKYGPRLTMVLGALIMGSGYLLVSRIHDVWQLYLTYGIIMGLGASAADVALLSTVARWFDKRRSLMSGFVKAGTGVGMFIIPLMSAWLLVSYGWRTSYAILGAMAIVGITIFALFLKRDPSEVGLRPYGVVDGAIESQNIPDVKLTFSEVLRTWQFWVICATYFLIWYATQAIIVHIAPHAIDSGFSVGQAAGILSAIGGVSILGRLTAGGTGDRIGNRRALIVCSIILLLSLIWLQFARELWMFYLFALIYGFAHGGFFALMSPLVADLFGLESHASNLGMFLFLGMAGGAVGPVVTGCIFDATHTYRLAFLVLVFTACVGLFLAFLLKPVNPDRQPMRTTV
jgi:MFS family permease